MSRNSFSLTLLLATLLLTSLLWVGSGPIAQADNSGTKIGYVDITHVYNNYTKVAERKQELEAIYKEEIERLQKDEDSLGEIQGKLEILSPQSDAYLELARDYAERSYRVRYQLQLSQREFSLDIGQLTREVYAEIVDEISTYSRRHEFQLILKIDPEVSVNNPQVDPIKYVANRQILYHANARDITQPLLETLNRNYIRKK